MLRKTRFKSLHMRRAAAKTKLEAERQRWEKLSRKELDAATNDNATLRERLQRSLEMERAKKKERDK